MEGRNHTEHGKRNASGGCFKDQEDKFFKGNEREKKMRKFRIWTLIPGQEKYVHHGLFEAENRLAAASQMIREDAVTRQTRKTDCGVIFESTFEGKLVQTVITSEHYGS